MLKAIRLGHHINDDCFYHGPEWFVVFDDVGGRNALELPRPNIHLGKWCQSNLVDHNYRFAYDTAYFRNETDATLCYLAHR